MIRAAAFILHGPTMRAKLWRLAYVVDYRTGKRLKGNRPVDPPVAVWSPSMGFGRKEA